MNRFEDSYAMYVNSRQQQQPSNDVILRFLNYCATIIQKHVKGYQHRERHKVIMMRIRRFKQLLNAFISGYKVRKILKLSEINGIIFDIQETDDGTYGNPITEKKKTRLIQRINQLFVTGSYTQNRKQSKSSKNLKQINNNLPFQNQNKQEEYAQIKKQQYDMPNRSKGQYDQNPDQGSGTNRNFDERTISNKKQYNQSESQQNLKQRKLNVQDDDIPIQARGQYQFNEPNKQSFEDQPIRSKGQYQYEEQPINPKGQQVNQYDEQPIKSKGSYANQFDEKPIPAKGSYSNPYDEQPIGGNNKGLKQNQFDEQPIGGKGSYSNPYDEQPISSKGGYSNQYEDKPLTSKGQYDYEEPQEEKPKPKPKAKPKKKVVNEDIKQEYDDIKQSEKYDNEFQAAEDQPKKKKQDPKAIENLKKRTKYDPRKAIQEAKKKEEEQQLIEQQAVQMSPDPKQETPPKQKKQQQPQQKTPVKQVQIKQEVKSDIEVEIVQDSEDQLNNQPKNFLKRKSKKVPLNNPKQEPKNIKSKVNCWTQNEDVEVEPSDDTHLSPKGYMQTRSPSKRFEQQQQQQQQQQQTIQQSQIPIIRQQIQIQQAQQQQQQQQQKGVKKISIEELEKTYNTNYTQKYSTTMSQLSQLNQSRLIGSATVPIITVRSRFYATFRLSEFENLLQILEDQYIRLSSK